MHSIAIALLQKTEEKKKLKQFLNKMLVIENCVSLPRLRLFQKFVTFRILVCGGDGSVGWVLSELDKLNLHKQVRTDRDRWEDICGPVGGQV